MQYENPYSGPVPKTAENCVILMFLWLTIFKDFKDTCLCGIKMLEAIHSFLSAPTVVSIKTLRVASHPEGRGLGCRYQCQGLHVTGQDTHRVS